MDLQEITAFAEAASERERDRLRAESDRYDGLTPDEINALVANAVPTQ